MSQLITVSSPKCDGLLFSGMTTDEQLGRMFSYHLEFASRDAAIDLSGLLGSPMTVTLATADGFEREFNGIVCEAAQTGAETVDGLHYAHYNVRLVPRPWLLVDKVDCRIYTQMSVPEIVKQVLSDAGYTDLQLSLSASYAKRDYCVQYRESCLNFISRLLEQEGIYYFFTHKGGTHTMVLADGVGAHAKAPHFDKVPYSTTRDSVLRPESTITEWVAARGRDATKYQLIDYDPLKPKTSLLANGSFEGHGGQGPELFDFPGEHQEPAVGKHYAQIRAEALSASRSHCNGATSACGIAIGGLFTLRDHPRSDQNREYLVIATAMQLHGGDYASGGAGAAPSFSCNFQAIESNRPFRSLPSAAKPVVMGLQTAVVTGSETDEDIAIDDHGRVQVTFHWNRPDKPGARSSCPVRVASTWAGKGWGAVSLPRVGQEVVVSFLEGDPDRPLIIGSVYNGDNTPPYGLQATKTQSGVKSRSLLGGAADFNELRFEDKKGQEDFFIHAQKDMHEEVENDHVVTIDHDETVTVKHDQTLTVENDQTGTIKHDRKVTVQNDDKLDVTNNGTTGIGKKFKLSAGTEIELVTGASSIVLKSSGDIEIKGVNIKITGSVSVKVEGQAEVGVKAGAKMDLGAGASLKMHSDAMLEVAGGAMATVKAPMLTLKGDGMNQVSGGIVMIG
ncbi:type VI secretion system tip protein TssI/VgrG [Frateuria sp. STR12]|uniref:type VI secretion system tip protein TssI/VgrG n=1 Tax=Frateuria hangzhouensis TaxID=2995589 RepID=UPI00226082AA|nr:type VI secretion system tip protein TssI/VgrG [Frateuria sp. STR12]MCX7514336.1 type VI secretion system tip protein TssI/VgrG [Frateuria sp. STR12]